MTRFGQPWESEHEIQIGAQLETLFALQDKALTKEKKSIWLEELRNCGLPPQAILKGIEQLKADELGSLKYGTVIMAARKFTEVEESQSCKNCNNGFVTMKDHEGRIFSLSCSCFAGSQKKGYVKWNGEESQSSKGRILVKYP